MLIRDLRYAMRQLRRAPGFTIMSIAVIAIGIGATTSLFTVVRSVMLRPLPFRDPDKLVMIFEHFRNNRLDNPSSYYNPVAPADFYDWRAQTHGFEDMAAIRSGSFNLTGEHGELPEVVQGRGGSWNLFPLLGVNAAIGRTFTASEDRPDGDVVMLTWSIFVRRFAGDASIVGKQIHLAGTPYTVVGVLPKWFTYPDERTQIWVPFAAGMQPDTLKHHDYHFARVVARLRPDVSLSSALSQVGALQYQMHLQNLNAPVAEDVASKTLIEDLAGDVKKPLSILLWAVACMLLIGCLNVANLMVARSAARQKEIAIRSALGARRMTLIREQLVESMLVSIAGGAVGLVFSVAATKWLVSMWRNLPSCAEYPCRRGSAGVGLRSRLDNGLAGRSAAGDFIDAQECDRGAAGFVAQRGRQPIAYRLAQNPAHLGDCDDGSPFGRGRPSAQELLAFADDRCGLRNRQRAHDELRPYRKEI